MQALAIGYEEKDILQAQKVFKGFQD